MVSYIKSFSNMLEAVFINIAFLLAFASALSFATSGAAATYHVSKAGNDRNPGTETEPWLTIQKAANTMRSGDTTIINDGAYPEKVSTTASGILNAPIVFRATSTMVVVGAFSVSNSHITIDGFTLTGNQASGYQGSVTVFSGGDFLTVKNCVFDSSPVEVYQFSVYHTGTLPTYSVVENCQFINGKYHAVNLGGSDHILRNCFFSGIYGGDAIRANASRTLIQGNTFEEWENANINSGSLVPGLRYWFVTVGTGGDFSNVGAGSGPYVTGESLNWKCTGELPTSWGQGYTLRNANHGDLIQAFSSGGVVAQDVIVDGNLATNCDNMQIGMIEDQEQNGGVARWRWTNNIFYNVDAAMHIYAPDFEFYNNLFILSGRNTGHPILFRYSTNKNSANNARVFNNIFIDCGSDPSNSSRGWYGFDAGITGLEADNNLVIGTGGGATKIGFASGGREDNGLNGVDPLLVDDANGDFRLSEGSPAIGAGIALNLLFTTDHVGSERGMAWDIGPYEFTTVGLPPAPPSDLEIQAQRLP